MTDAPPRPVVLHVIGAVTMHTADRLRRRIRAGAGRPLRLIVESGGGLALECLDLAKAIEAHDGPTEAWVSRQCESGAALLFGACQRRVAHPDARFLLHAAAALVSWREVRRWTRAELVRRANILDDVDAVLAGFWARRLGLPLPVAMSFMDGDDIAFNAVEAERIGLLTEPATSRPWGPETQPIGSDGVPTHPARVHSSAVEGAA